MVKAAAVPKSPVTPMAQKSWGVQEMWAFSMSGTVTNINVAATAVSDPALHDLCNSVTSTTEDLLGVLNKLKVEGPKSKWTSLRKAIRIVWSKEQIQDLERRLAEFRDELNLHIVVRLR